MNLSDRVKELFGLQDEPNCSVSINLDSGELQVDCGFDLICISVRRTVLDRLIDAGAALNIPHINITCGGKLIYRFPPASAFKYRAWQAEHERNRRG